MFTTGATAIISLFALGATAISVHQSSAILNLVAQTESVSAQGASLHREHSSRLSERAVLPPQEEIVPTATLPTAEQESPQAEPIVTIGERGKKNYFFKELRDPAGNIIARDAQFRELLGLSKLSFKTSEGTRYFGLDDLHPRVLSSLGYDAAVLKRRMAEERAQQALRGAQARLHQELRVQAAQEAAAREAAAAERVRAEAALREAQARERLANVAEGIATNPPKPPQVNVRVVNVNRYITNTN